MNRPEFAALSTAALPSRLQRMAVFRKPGSDVALLAAVQIVCFLMLMRLEPSFVIIHLYQTIPYAAILLLVGYSLDRWAYAIGALVSIIWLGLAYMAGLLSSAAERLRTLRNSDTADNLVAVLALATAGLAVLITVLCRIHWVKEHFERRANRRIFAISLAMVAVYYLVLALWFWDMIPDA